MPESKPVRSELRGASFFTKGVFLMDMLHQVMGEPGAVTILGPKSFHWGMFIDNQAEYILKIRPGFSYGRDGINFIPIHCCNVLKKGLHHQVLQGALGYNHWGPFD